MLIGKVNWSRRERLMVTTLDRKGSKVIDLRVYNILDDGELMPTPAGITLEPDQVESVIALLKEAKTKSAAAD